MLSRIYTICIFVVIVSFVTPLQAEQQKLKQFVSGSYQKLVAENTKKPLMLTIWSTTCSTCLQKMSLLRELQKSRTDINFVMLSTDDVSVASQVKSVLLTNQLTSVENWIFADKNEQKLRYEIDPTWYGELPRTYFYNKNNERVGISGAISQQAYETIFKKMFN